MIHLDISVLVAALTGAARLAGDLRAVVGEGERVVFSTMVLYEWLRGPRTPGELRAQAVLFSSDQAIPFDTRAAERAAALYRLVARPRGREIDLAIASCAIEQDAALWTLNIGDFRDIPRLRLHVPARRRG